MWNIMLPRSPRASPPARPTAAPHRASGARSRLQPAPLTAAPSAGGALAILSPALPTVAPRRASGSLLLALQGTRRRSGEDLATTQERKRSWTSQRQVRQQVEIIRSLREGVEAEARAERWVVDPDSAWLRCWYAAAIAATLFQLGVVPMRLAFRTHLLPVRSLWIALDVVCDAAYFLDLWLGFYTGFYSHGNKVMRRAGVRAHYLRTDFGLALCCALPLDLAIQLTCGCWIPEARLNRLFRLPLSFRRMRVLFGVQTTALPTWLKVLQLLITMLLLAHVCGCLWFAMAWYEPALGFGANLWLPAAELGTQPLLIQYLVALRWGLTALTGFAGGELPHTAPEAALTIATTLAGTFFFAFTIGVLAKADEVKADPSLCFQAKMRNVMLSMKLHRLPPALRSRVVTFFLCQHEVFHGYEEEALLRELPDALYMEIMLHQAGASVRQVPLLVATDVIYIYACIYIYIYIYICVCVCVCVSVCL